MVYDTLLLISIFALSALGMHLLEAFKKKLIGSVMILISFILTWLYAIYFFVGLLGMVAFLLGLIAGHVVKFFKK